MTATLTAQRSAIDASPTARKWFSPATFGLVSVLERVLVQTVSGRVLDVGCGSMPYRPLVESTGSTYIGLDVEARTEGVEIIGSATDMADVAHESVDTVLCSEVLEHISDPAAALAEMGRVLTVDGRLVLTVPFLGRLHEEPHDYFRYTEHGLRVLLEGAGFSPESFETTGSLFSLLGHQLSSLAVVGAWRVPGLRYLALAANVAFIVGPARLGDRLLGPLQRKLPLGYVVTARRIRDVE